MLNTIIASIFVLAIILVGVAGFVGEIVAAIRKTNKRVEESKIEAEKHIAECESNFRTIEEEYKKQIVDLKLTIKMLETSKTKVRTDSDEFREYKEIQKETYNGAIILETQRADFANYQSSLEEMHKQEIEQRAKQMLDDEFPEYKKYYEQYKTLCDDERLALKNFAQKLEPALVM